MEELKMKNPRIGDLVRVINYGHSYFVYKESGLPKPATVYEETKDIWFGDSRPELVGQLAVINKIASNAHVGLQFRDRQAAWFNPKTQLELISQNPNTPEGRTIISLEEKLIREIQQGIRNLRDSDNHICPDDPNTDDPDGTCDCEDYDKLIEKLENLLNHESKS